MQEENFFVICLCYLCYSDLSSSGRRTQLNESFHIAFGTKIGKPPTAGVGRKSTSSGLPSHRDSMRASAGGAVRESYTGM